MWPQFAMQITKCALVDAPLRSAVIDSVKSGNEICFFFFFSKKGKNISGFCEILPLCCSAPNYRLIKWNAVVVFYQLNTGSINYGGDQNNVIKSRDEDSWQSLRDKDRVNKKQQFLGLMVRGVTGNTEGK